MSSHRSDCDTTDYTGSRMLGHEPVKEELKLDSNNNNTYFSLNFDTVDLCLPLLDCHQEELATNVRKPRIASESSTIYDACSSSSSTVSNPASNNFTHSNDKCLSDHIIDYKPTTGSPVLPETNNSYSHVHQERADKNITQSEGPEEEQLPILNPVVVESMPTKTKKRSGGNSNLSGEILSDGINLVSSLVNIYIYTYDLFRGRDPTINTMKNLGNNEVNR